MRRQQTRNRGVDLVGFFALGVATPASAAFFPLLVGIVGKLEVKRLSCLFRRSYESNAAVRHSSPPAWDSDSPRCRARRCPSAPSLASNPCCAGSKRPTCHLPKCAVV